MQTIVDESEARMAPKAHLITLGLGLLALLCWAIMFLAGTDVWHAVGRPDFWHLAGAPYPDLRALAYAFYLLFAVLAAQAVVTVFAIIRARARGRLTGRAADGGACDESAAGLTATVIRTESKR